MVAVAFVLVLVLGATGVAEAQGLGIPRITIDATDQIGRAHV